MKERKETERKKMGNISKIVNFYLLIAIHIWFQWYRRFYLFNNNLYLKLIEIKNFFNDSN